MAWLERKTEERIHLSPGSHLPNLGTKHTTLCCGSWPFTTAELAVLCRAATREVQGILRLKTHTSFGFMQPLPSKYSLGPKSPRFYRITPPFPIAKHVLQMPRKTHRLSCSTQAIKNSLFPEFWASGELTYLTFLEA